MLYNNPVAYGTDFLPEQIRELAAEHENLAAVKESSTDVRRITWIKELTKDRLDISVGVDDAILEGIAAGAVGWVAGLVNALPKESVELFNYALNGEHEKARELYYWFLRAVDQARAGGSRNGIDASASAAIRADRRRARRSARRDSSRLGNTHRAEHFLRRAQPMIESFFKQRDSAQLRVRKVN
jgi:dihydrodipicolinate synthase/N-acetylneuraminate lyase